MRRVPTAFLGGRVEGRVSCRSSHDPVSASAVITLGTSGVVALLVRSDRRHRRAVRALEVARMPTVVPVGILAEVDRVLGRRLAPAASLTFLEGIETGETLLDCGDLDLPRIRALMTRYAELPLGFPDAAVIACAERNGGTVLTFDRDGLGTVSRDLPITLIP
ncbi:MAG: PIN domain-containing protein [Actinobacteria bacterium]|nr:MAG: PIN domain-containing protein [Actinomycetota bacterium]TMK93869.1 MAG: PIN domain-containing protein [Actinomycetota bacterium]